MKCTQDLEGNAVCSPDATQDASQQGASLSKNPVWNANNAPGGGNGFAGALLQGQKAAPGDPKQDGKKKESFFSRMKKGFYAAKSTFSGTAVEDIAGAQEGVVFDNTEKGANEVNTDILGNNAVSIPKLRVKSVDRDGAHAENVSADGLSLKELQTWM